MHTLRLSQIKLGNYIPPLRSSKSLLNGEDSYLWIKEHKPLVGWTYDYNPHAILIESFERLISCKGLARKNVRIANNVHVKCYIHTNVMLIGSFNLTFPTIVDLCYLVTDKKAVDFYREQFEEHWKHLESK